MYVLFSTLAGVGVGSKLTENPEDGGLLGGLAGFFGSILTLPDDKKAKMR